MTQVRVGLAPSSARTQPEIPDMTAAPQAGARAVPYRPDWRRAAEMLAQGHTAVEVARTLPCSRSQLSRKRNHDPQFQAWIAKYQHEDLTPDGRMARLRRAWDVGIEKAVGKGDVRILLWLADRLNLVAPPSEQTPGGELRDILSGLSPEELREFQDLGDPDQGDAAQNAGDLAQPEPARTTTSSPAR
jgi:hypothetical protein